MFYPTVKKDLIEQYISGFPTEIDVYRWFDGYIKQLKEFNFEIAIFLIDYSNIIFGESNLQVVFKRSDYASFSTMPISLKRMEELLGKFQRRMREKT
jgi:sulfur relay (sulfurtransferase) DsrC/TusE family protein